MADNRDRFLKLLKNEILKLDLPELDFGIYRLLNFRRAEVHRFFDEELPLELDAAMAAAGASRRDELQRRVDDVRMQLDGAAKSLGLGDAIANGALKADLEGTQKGTEYLAAVDELEHFDAGAPFAESELDRLYNQLFTFFSRYYSDGDFEPQQRRARNARYSVPYGGEDVHFAWRSRDSHYIKTSEELRSWQLQLGAIRVRFELVDAYEEPDGAKGATRYFIPVTEDAAYESQTGGGGTFRLPFRLHHLTPSEEAAVSTPDGTDGATTQERIVNLALENLEPPIGLEPDELRHHVLRYVRRSRADYFVHPRLGDFLRGELEYYLGAEVAAPNGLMSPHALADRITKIVALRTIANRVIDLLAEIEGFQAQLFEKARFVLRTAYLVSIRAVPDQMIDEVLANDRQIGQWADMFCMTMPIDRTVLETHPSLVVDTRLFEADFQTRLLTAFDDLDGAVGGILVKGENYGALRTLRGRFAGRVSITYADPPYNTGKDEFLFKDDFSRHSAWLSMMRGRVAESRDLLRPSGIFVCSISDIELPHLILACDGVFGSGNRQATIIWNNEGNIDNQSRIKGAHEYLLLYSREDARFEAPHVIDPSVPADGKLYNETIANTITKNGRANPRSDVLLPVGFPTDFEQGVIEPGTTRWPRLSNRVRVKGFKTLDPVTANSGWSSRNLLDQFIAAGLVKIKDRRAIPTWFGLIKTGAIYVYKERPGTQSHVLSVIRGVGTTQQMSGVLRHMGLNFTYPKPIGLLEYVTRWHNDPEGWALDFFAGSGTSAHAVVNVNRQYGSARRFIAVEVAAYFDTVLVPRMQMVMYSPNWKDRRPDPEPSFQAGSVLPDWVERTPKLVQLVELEGYDDALNSLRIDTGGPGVAKPSEAIGYLLRDAAGISEAALSTQALEHPFDYHLEIHTANGIERVTIDLPETYAFLAGIEKKRIRVLDGDGRRYLLQDGLRGEQKVLVVWRDVDGLDSAAERAFLERDIPLHFGVQLSDYDRVYHNADSALLNGFSLDAEFKQLMLSRSTAK